MALQKRYRLSLTTSEAKGAKQIEIGLPHVCLLVVAAVLLSCAVLWGSWIALHSVRNENRYRAEIEKLAAAPGALLPPAMEARFALPHTGRREIAFLGSAGQRIVTAGELLCLAGTSAGLHATLKNDYPITVLRGHSVSEIILNDAPIGYTGSKDPAAVVALAPEGVARRKTQLAQLSDTTLVIKAKGLELPATRARVREVDFKQYKVKTPDWALAALALVAGTNRVITLEMLNAAITMRFKNQVRDQALALVERVTNEIDLQ